MNITNEQWSPEEDEDLTPESLVSRLLNECATEGNFVRGMQDIEYLLQEAVDKSKQTE